MSPDQIFALANLLAMSGWILLVIFPRRPWATRTLPSLIVPALIAIAYSGIMLRHFSGANGGFSSLDRVALLFSNRWLLLAGWIHYLAFDLLVGSWEVRDSRERGIPHALVVPCLALTFLFGPAGWLLYMVVRSAASRTAVPA